MAISEGARADLYHGLTEVLGNQRAETLMSVLPSYQMPDLATKGDIALLMARIDTVEVSVGSRIDSVEVSLGGRIGRLEDQMDGLEDRMDRLVARMDRLFIAMVAGMFLIVATLIGGFFTL